QLLAATKNVPLFKTEKLLQEGHTLFGENKVQEAYRKWPTLKRKYPKTQLHLIGHLQTNKVKRAVALFDVIETLDNVKLAQKLIDEELKQQKRLEYYIEINIGHEPQKTGVLPEDFHKFYETLTAEFPLRITGVMCIPPANQNPVVYFQ